MKCKVDFFVCVCVERERGGEGCIERERGTERESYKCVYVPPPAQ